MIPKRQPMQSASDLVREIEREADQRSAEMLEELAKTTERARELRRKLTPPQPMKVSTG